MRICFNPGIFGNKCECRNMPVLFLQISFLGEMHHFFHPKRFSDQRFPAWAVKLKVNRARVSKLFFSVTLISVPRS